MQLELENYGKFVIYNGMYHSCKVSKKPAEYLLQALYSITGKFRATEFFLKGLKQYIQESGIEETLSRLNFSSLFLEEVEKANQWVTDQENLVYLAAMKKLQDKHTKLNHIDRYKSLELNKSIIFKHLKSID